MSLALRTIAQFFSALGHPLFMIFYMFFLYRVVNPYLFPHANEKNMGLLSLVIIFTSIVIPVIGILLMKGVGFVSSLEMKDRKERIGPLMITGVFYIWLYLNIRTHSAIPVSYATFVLGALISLALAFFINNFSKISLHGVGLGGFLGGTLYLFLAEGREYLTVRMTDSLIMVHYLPLLILLILTVGMILSSRLYLRAHVNRDIMGGFVVGLLGQMVAYGLLG